MAVSSLTVTVRPSQLSVAVAISSVTSMPNSIVSSAGTEVNSGAVVSWTVMVWVAVEALPQSSDAVKVRIKVYSLAQSPAMISSSTEMITSSQLSVAVGKD